MKYLIIILFVSVHLFFGMELGYSTINPLYTHFTYPFQHLGWVHLAINSIAFISMYNVLSKAIHPALVLIYSYVIAVAVSFVSEEALPTVGASGMVYAMCGMFISMAGVGSKLRIKDWRKFWLFIACLAIAMLASVFKGIANNTCHVLALTVGVMVGTLDELLNP